MVLDVLDKLNDIHTTVIMLSVKALCAIIFRIGLGNSLGFKHSLGVLPSLVRIIALVRGLLVQSEVNPFIIKTIRDINSINLFWSSLSERSLYLPGQPVRSRCNISIISY